ncbi:hypothetical protein OH492_09785 [Vibrio chagasii]|nr:hypothetical protein [Vibrio chagasii]
MISFTVWLLSVLMFVGSAYAFEVTDAELEGLVRQQAFSDLYSPY